MSKNSWLYGLMLLTFIGILSYISNIYRSIVERNIIEKLVKRRSKDDYKAKRSIPYLVGFIVGLVGRILIIFKAWPSMSNTTKAIYAAEFLLSIIINVFLLSRISKIKKESGRMIMV